MPENDQTAPKPRQQYEGMSILGALGHIMVRGRLSQHPSRLPVTVDASDDPPPGEGSNHQHLTEALENEPHNRDISMQTSTTQEFYGNTNSTIASLTKAIEALQEIRFQAIKQSEPNHPSIRVTPPMKNIDERLSSNESIFLLSTDQERKSYSSSTSSLEDDLLSDKSTSISQRDFELPEGTNFSGQEVATQTSHSKTIRRKSKPAGEDERNPTPPIPSSPVFSRNTSVNIASATVFEPIPDHGRCSKCELFQQMFNLGEEDVSNDKFIMDMFKKHKEYHFKRAKMEMAKLYNWNRNVIQLEDYQTSLGKQKRDSIANSYFHIDQQYADKENSHESTKNPSLEPNNRKSIDRYAYDQRKPRHSNGSSDLNPFDGNPVAKEYSEEVIRRQYFHRNGSQSPTQVYDDDKNVDDNYIRQVERKKEGTRYHSSKGRKITQACCDDCCYYKRERKRPFSANCQCQCSQDTDEESFQCCVDDYERENHRRCSTAPNRRAHKQCSLSTSNRKDNFGDLDQKLKSFIAGMIKGMTIEDNSKSRKNNSTSREHQSHSQSELNKESKFPKNGESDSTSLPSLKKLNGESLSKRNSSESERGGESMLEDMTYFMVRKQPPKEKKLKDGDSKSMSGSPAQETINVNTTNDSFNVTRDSDPNNTNSSDTPKLSENRPGFHGNFNLNNPDVQGFVTDILGVFCSEFLSERNRTLDDECASKISSGEFFSCETRQGQRSSVTGKSALTTKLANATDGNCSKKKSQKGRSSHSYFYPVCNNLARCEQRSVQIEDCSCCNPSCAMPLQEAFKRCNTVCYQRIEKRQRCLSNLKRERETSQRAFVENLIKSPLQIQQMQTYCCNSTNNGNNNNVCGTFTYVVPQSRVKWCSM